MNCAVAIRSQTQSPRGLWTVLVTLTWQKPLDAIPGQAGNILEYRGLNNNLHYFGGSGGFLLYL